jgi:hypothetical protein
VALVALTIALSALFGRLLGNYWAGTLIVAVLELGVAFLLVKRGVQKMAAPAYTFPESRAALSETAQWVKAVREPELRPRANGAAREDAPRVTTLARGLPERAD